ncbi:MAG: hypothetical protein R3F65_23605 [bacterium]
MQAAIVMTSLAVSTPVMGVVWGSLLAAGIVASASDARRRPGAYVAHRTFGNIMQRHEPRWVSGVRALGAPIDAARFLAAGGFDVTRTARSDYALVARTEGNTLVIYDHARQRCGGRHPC